MGRVQSHVIVLALFEEGMFARNMYRILFVDAHYLSLCGESNSKDDNHYDSNMQTALWTVLSHAFRLWKVWLYESSDRYVS